MGLLGDVGDTIVGALEGGVSALDKLASGTNNQRAFEQDGFIVPPIPAGIQEGLPSSSIPSARQHKNKRHIMHWYIPEVGMIQMYVNPQSIDYSFQKLITKERTKGGFNLQFWGEELPTLSIRGTTGSSGVEGLNVLYEMYRAEQFTFDPIALTMASDASISGLSDLLNVGGALGGAAGNIFSSVTNGILGLNPLTQSILPNSPATLASLAFGVEMYYGGWVFRGYFTEMSWTESVDRMGVFDYNLKFVVTQRRGYRLNYLPHHKSANDGPSNNSIGGVPLSYGRDAR